MVNNRPNLPKPTELLNALLDRGYVDATRQVIGAIGRETESGSLSLRLKQFDDRAKELADKNEAMSVEDPALRALLADFGDSMRRNAIRIDAAAPELQSLGIDAAGQFVRQTTLPGFSDLQLQSIGVGWNVPDPEAVRALVQFTSTDAWKAELNRYSTGLEQRAREIAIQGIVSGQGPLATARDLRELIESMPIWRANSLLRTTQLESYRAAAAANQDANRDILDVQVRIAALDDRCCLACIALHGTEMPIGAQVEDHDQGRCTSVTKVKGELGDMIFQQYVGGDQVTFKNGAEWFASLPEDQQRAIAGPGAFEALQKNEVQLQDFVQPYSSPIFGDMIRQAGLETARDNPNRMVQTVEGRIRADRGTPGDNIESVNAFLDRSDGPLARAMKDEEMALFDLDWETSQVVVNADNVKQAAKRFVAESQDIQYSKDYILSLVQEEAARNGQVVTLKQAEKLYNEGFGYQAQAIQTAADVGKVKLTDAQWRRLEAAISGDYLSVVYTTESSLHGSLANATKRTVTYGGNFYATDAARKEARREFLDRLGRLDA